MPAPSAPSMSTTRESPTNTHCSGGRPSRSQVRAKISGRGFSQPTSLLMTTVSNRSVSWWVSRISRSHRSKLETRAI